MTCRDGALRLGCLWLAQCIFAWGVMVAFTRPAQAKVDPEALIMEGIELRRAGRDADALPKFDQAYELGKTPRAAAQLGLCLQALARWADADPKLAEALTSTQDPWVKKNRETLKDALEQVKARVGRVEIVGKPPGAEVAVNGRVVGTLPLSKPVLVNEGPVDIEVSAPGYKRGIKNLTVSGASYQSVVIRLEEAANVPTAPPPALAMNAPSAKHENARLVVSADSAATTDESRPITKELWFWAGAVAVVGAVVLGVVLVSGSGPKDPKFDQVHTF